MVPAPFSLEEGVRPVSLEIVLIVFLGVAFAVSLAYNLGLLGGPQRAPAASHTSQSQAPANALAADDDRANRLELDLEKKRKELDEVKRAQGELKEELKAAKKKLFEQKEAHKGDDDLEKARGEVERQASIQLENTRHELATALAEVQRLKAEAEGKSKRKPEPAAAEKQPEPARVEKQEIVQRVIRELSDIDKERIARLEQQSSSDRKKAAELERELKALKGKLDRHQRESKRVYTEANLSRDKFRAVETRLNRTLLENDLLKRALADLEKKTGLHAEHTQLTAAEVAESDRSMREKHAAEDRAEAEVRARMEAAPATEDSTGEATEAAVSAPPELAPTSGVVPPSA